MSGDHEGARAALVLISRASVRRGRDHDRTRQNYEKSRQLGDSQLRCSDQESRTKAGYSRRSLLAASTGHATKTYPHEP